MKALIGNIVFAAAVASAITPAVSSAQNIASPPGSLNRGLGKLTLLPGPDLLSPARGAPQSTPAITIVPAALVHRPDSATRLAPATEHFMIGGQSSLHLIERKSINPLSLSGRIAEPPRDPKLPPTPDELRFDSRLEAPSLPMKPALPR